MRIPTSAMLPALVILAVFGCHAGFAFTVLAGEQYLGTGPPEVFCDGYGNAAVSKVNTAVKARCGFAGPRWSADKEMHRKWCLGLNGDQTLPYSEDHARSAELDACFAWCRSYAKQADDAATKNGDLLKCGYTGPRWSREKDDHAIWCQYFGTHALANAETAARSAALAECIQAQAANKKRLDDLGGVSKPRSGFDQGMKKP